MKTMGIFAVKTHLSEILESGEGVTITKRGEPIAEIVPVKARKSTPTGDEVLEGFKKLRRQVKERYPARDTLSVRELINEGRK